MNSFGRIFRITIFGESHGPAVGVIIDGCPSGVEVTADDFGEDLSRRQGGGTGTTARRETDAPQIVSGIFNNYTTGAPIHLLFANADVRPADYEKLKHVPRPGHADFVAYKKFGGYSDYRGGGHFSGRLTLPLVAAGVIAKKIIAPIHITSRLTEAGGDARSGRAVQEAIAARDSIGGIVECRAQHMPIGLGEPFFDSVESLISHLVFSIPAVKAIEFGAGFAAARMRGSQHNDPIIDADGSTETNNAGGISGGITNGNDLFMRVAVKPTPTIPQPQKTVNLITGEKTDLVVEGRHDTCIALRVPVIIESAVAVVLADLMLIEGQITRMQR